MNGCLSIPRHVIDQLRLIVRVKKSDTIGCKPCQQHVMSAAFTPAAQQRSAPRFQATHSGTSENHIRLVTLHKLSTDGEIAALAIFGKPMSKKADACLGRAAGSLLPLLIIGVIGVEPNGTN